MYGKNYVGLDASADGRTKQSFKAQCNVNTIVDKARRTGLVSHLNSKTPVYMDVTQVPDFQTAYAIVQEAQDAFDALDARVRRRFDNDPGKMVEFLSDVRNNAEAAELGLIKKVESNIDTPSVVETPVVE